MALLAPPVVEPLLRRIREIDSAPAIEAALLPREPSLEWLAEVREDYLAERPWLTGADAPEATEPGPPAGPPLNPPPPPWYGLWERWQSPGFKRLVVPLLALAVPVLMAGILVLARPSSTSSAAVPADLVVAASQSEVVRLDVVGPVAPRSLAPLVRPATAFEIGLSSVVPGERATFAVQSAASMTCTAVVEHGGATPRQVLAESTGTGMLWTWPVPATALQSGGHVMLTCDGRTTRIPFALDAPPIGRLMVTGGSAASTDLQDAQQPLP